MTPSMAVYRRLVKVGYVRDVWGWVRVRIRVRVRVRVRLGLGFRVDLCTDEVTNRNA